MSTSKTLYTFNRWSSGALWRLILFYWVLKLLPEAVSMRSIDEDYGSLSYAGAPLLRVSLCAS